jgi:hypothetical protein
MLGPAASDAMTRGSRLAWTGYAAANVVALGAGARQAGAASGQALSGWFAVLACLAGTSGLLWGVVALRREPSDTAAPPLPRIERRWWVIVLGAAVALAFVAVLGPGVHVVG